MCRRASGEASALATAVPRASHVTTDREVSRGTFLARRLVLCVPTNLFFWYFIACSLTLMILFLIILKTVQWWSTVVVYFSSFYNKIRIKRNIAIKNMHENTIHVGDIWFCCLHAFCLQYTSIIKIITTLTLHHKEIYLDIWYLNTALKCCLHIICCSEQLIVIMHISI